MKDWYIIVALAGLAILLIFIQPQFPPVPFETIAAGEESGNNSREALVITDQEQWEALWERHVSLDRNPSPVPEVDFKEEMVIAVFAGTKSAGYMVRITGIERRKQELAVHYFLVGPSCTKCELPRGMVQPFHMVKLERLDLPVVFHRG